MAVPATVIVAASDPQELIVFGLDPDSGTLTERGRTPIPSPTPAEPSGLPVALSPDRRFVHVAPRQEPFPIVSFAYDPASAALTWIGGSTIARRPAQMAMDQTGRYLFTASYAGHIVSVGPVDAAGAALPATRIIGTPEQTHGVAVAPDNRHVYAASMAGDVVIGFNFDAATGLMEDAPFTENRSAPGAGPRHMIFGAGGRHLYALTEHHGTLLVFHRDPATGLLAERQCLSILPDTLFRPGAPAVARPPPGAADLRLSPDGTRLFASDRVTDTVATFAADPATGLLTPLASSTVRPTPRSIAVDPSGRYLVTLGVWEGTVNTYRIAANGGLTEAFSRKIATTADWVEAFQAP
jgi:6-phosphogluconolactonase